MKNKILDELERTYHDIEKSAQNEEYIKGCKNMYESCRAIIEKHSGEPEWIPCSERLPEQSIETCDGVHSSETVIITIINDEGVSSSVDFLLDDKWACSTLKDDVIAWMPLPEPYKEDN